MSNQPRKKPNPRGGKKRKTDGRGKTPGSQKNWFLPGNQAAVTHGGYVSELPPEIAEQAAELPSTPEHLAELIQLERGRLFMVLKKEAEWNAKVDYNALAHSDYQLNEVVARASNGEKQTTTKRVRPDFEAQIDRLVGRIGYLVLEHTRIERQLSLTGDEAAALRKQIIDQGEAEAWSCTQIGLEIEKRGLEVPFTLQAQIKRELSFIEPEEPDNGLTDDELERLSDEYQQEATSEQQWLEARHEDVKAIHGANQKRSAQ
ncbi:hypothetical protein [Modicisalibacter xianhensis]|uniref:Uncharacterized protein n=1 Tax=Modicisalibacter xianhensis TaxID=442341 RepID=A0A1I3GBR1_9GAMM|nr:hypothetical protein [Halomonas xianhensis]SFI20854.1 hypothetical protein SAMN04487959_12919 [Halomonas xianhensis]